MSAFYDGLVASGVPHGEGVFVLYKSGSAFNDYFPYMNLSPMGVGSFVEGDFEGHGRRQLELAGLADKYASAVQPNRLIERPNYLVVDGTFDNGSLDYSKPYNIAAAFTTLQEMRKRGKKGCWRRFQ